MGLTISTCCPTVFMIRVLCVDTHLIPHFVHCCKMENCSPPKPQLYKSEMLILSPVHSFIKHSRLCRFIKIKKRCPDPAEEQCGSQYQLQARKKNTDKCMSLEDKGLVFKSGILVWNKPLDQSLCTQQSIELAPNSKLLLNRHLAHKLIKREFCGNPSVSCSYCLSIHSLNLNAKKSCIFQ